MKNLNIKNKSFNLLFIYTLLGIVLITIFSCGISKRDKCPKVGQKNCELDAENIPVIDVIRGDVEKW